MTIQTHIHLAKTLGSAPENAPVYKWAVVFPNFNDSPNVVIGLNRTLSGALMTHRLQSGGNTIQFNDYEFTVKVVAEYSYTLAERKAQLKALNGEVVYFVLPDHAADGADHTGDIIRMFATVSDFRPYDPLMTRFDVNVSLVDHHTVT